MVSGYHIGQSRYRNISIMQNVLLGNASLKANLYFCKVLPLASLIPSCCGVSPLSPDRGVGVPICLRDDPGHFCYPSEPEKDTVKLTTIQHLREITQRH